MQIFCFNLSLVLDPYIELLIFRHCNTTSVILIAIFITRVLERNTLSYNSYSVAGLYFKI